MTDVRRARREAEKVAREALNGTLVDKAGELGVALAGQADAAANVAAARVKAEAIIEAAQAEGAALVAAAQAEAGEAGKAYAAAWNAGKDAGWSPAQLRAMGYAKPSSRRGSAGPSGANMDDVPVNDTTERQQHGDDVDAYAQSGAR